MIKLWRAERSCCKVEDAYLFLRKPGIFLGPRVAVLKKLNNFFLEMSERGRKQNVSLNVVQGGKSREYMNLGPRFSLLEQYLLLCSTNHFLM